MTINPATKVGMVTVLALILFGMIITQIGNTGSEVGTEYYVVFRNVGGLQVRSPVYLAGVKIGYVKDMELIEANQVKVSILITHPEVSLYRSRHLDEPPDTYYLYTITGNLLGDKWIEIRPGKVPPDTPPLAAGGEVRGEPPVTLDDLAREGNQVMKEFRKSVDALNQLVADEKFQSDIKTTMENFNEISKNLKGASKDARRLVADLNRRVQRIGNAMENVVAHVQDTVVTFQGDAKTIGADLRGFSSELHGVVHDNKGHIKTIVMNLRQTSISLKKTMRALEELAENKHLKDDVLATVNNLRRASKEVQGIAADIRSLTSDPEVQSDLRETVANAKEASQGAKRVVKKVEGIVDGVTGGKLASVYIEQEWNTRNGDTFTNLNGYLLPDAPYGAKIGVDALGRDNLVNLQAMKSWGNFRLRAGVVRSQFGIGADAFLFNKRLLLNLDTYDTQDVKVDLTGKLFLPGDFYIHGGYRDISDPRHGYPIIGAGKRF